LLSFAFAAAASVAEWFFIAGLSAAMKKISPLCELCASSGAGGERQPRFGALTMTDLTGRIALVTGASRGIGRSVAVALAEAGADVAINYRQMEKMARSTKEQIVAQAKRALTVRADVSSSVEVTRMIRTVEDKLGPIDILVNNAGMANPKGLKDITEEDWDETMSINLKSAFLVTQAVLPGMRERGWGRIINITSGAAYTGGIIGPHYSASTAGMEGLTRAYAALRSKKASPSMQSPPPVSRPI
jgi:3-oxoacyl-[acyl-carrier protein] reductase